MMNDHPLAIDLFTMPRRKSKVGSWDVARANFNADKKWEDGMKLGITHRSNGATNFHGFKSQGMNWSDRSIKGQDFTRIAGQQANGIKNKNADGYERNHPEAFGWKAPGTTSKCSSRKAASAMIAKIPFPLARWIAKVYFSQEVPVKMPETIENGRC